MSEGYVFGKVKAELEKCLKGNVIRNELLSKHTSFRVGGKAAVFTVANSLSELRLILEVVSKYNVCYFVIGKGSNLLVSDSGFKGVVIRLGPSFQKVYLDDNHLRAGAAAGLHLLAHAAYKNSFKNFTFLTGIPGSVGGALVLNAGAYGKSIGEIVSQVTVYQSDCSLKVLEGDKLSFGYRTSSLGKEGTIVEALFHTEDGKRAQIKAEMERYFKKRKETQPLDLPSAGSIFKNPPNASAAKLIEEAGLKGYRIGDTVVSPKHANFIVNCGGATARDIYLLVRAVQKEVYLAKGVSLEEEITLVGDFEELDQEVG